MQIINTISLFLLLVLVIYAGLSDLCSGVVKNRVLLVFFIFACAVAVARLLFLPGYRLSYSMNLLIMFGIAALLYCSHIWAGGDCKYIAVAAVLFPPEYYIGMGSTNMTLFLVVILAFLAGYLFILFDTIISAIRKKALPRFKSIAVGLCKFVLSYIKTLLYIAAFNLLYANTIGKIVSINSLVLCAVYYMLAFTVNNWPVFQKKWLLISVLVFDVIVSIIIKTVPIGTSPFHYVVLVIAVLIKMVAANYNYEVIPTEDVAAGMILSLETTMLFSKSRVKGLPGLSNENLGSRLTADEAASVRRWASSAYGLPQVTIVRKIPFAAFISAGFLLYLLIGGIIL